MKNFFLKIKKRLAILSVALLSLVLAALLSSCGGDGIDGDMAKKLAEITENCVVYAVGSSEAEVSVYDAYLAYFRIYPEKFDAFYNEKKAEIEKSEIGKCGLYSPKVAFKAVMPDGSETAFSYDLMTKKLRSSDSLWETYEYRYYELEGIYTEPEGGALIIDGGLNNVSGVAPESLVGGSFYVRLMPASVTVRLDTDGGEWSSDNEFELRMGEDILPYLNEIPEKDGYSFVGWKFTVGDKDAYPVAVVNFATVENRSARIMNEVNFHIGNARDDMGDNMMLNGKYEGYYSTDLYVTMTAQYTPEKHTVTYMNFDGTVFKTVEVNEGTVITRHNAEILSVYTCKGWSMTEGSDLIFETVTVDGDITFYPVAAESKTVTLYFSDGVTVACTVYETYPLDLSSIVPSGGGVKGWYLDSAYTAPVEDSVIAFEELADAYYADVK